MWSKFIMKRVQSVSLLLLEIIAISMNKHIVSIFTLEWLLSFMEWSILCTFRWPFYSFQSWTGIIQWWHLICNPLYHTMVTDWESIKPHLWSKLSLFKTSLQMLEVQLQLSPLYSSLPYLRPFQWGTVSPYISRGIKNTTG